MAKYILIEVEPGCVENMEIINLRAFAAQFFAPGPIMAKSVALAEDDGFGRIVTTRDGGCLVSKRFEQSGGREAVVIGNWPNCDFCRMERRTVAAEYDGATRQGPWANMCDKHFAQFGVGLGMGSGQQLFRNDVEEGD